MGLLVPFTLGSLWQDKRSVGLSFVQCPGILALVAEVGTEPSPASDADIRAHSRAHTFAHTCSSEGAGGPSAPLCCTAGCLQQCKPPQLQASTFPQSPDPNSKQCSSSARNARLPPPLPPAHADTPHSRFPFSHFRAEAKWKPRHSFLEDSLSGLPMGIFLPL